MKLCKICNKQFTPKIHNQVYCTNKCSIKNQVSRTKEQAQVAKEIARLRLRPKNFNIIQMNAYKAEKRKMGGF